MVVRIFLGIIACTLLLTLSGCESTTQTPIEKPDLIALYGSRLKIEGRNDPLEAHIEINSSKCFKYRHGLLRVVWNDAFLRGYVDKETGQAAYQVYTIQFHNNWAFPYQANYGVPLQTTKADRIYSGVECNSHNCDCEEHAIFTVDPDELDRIANLANSEEHQALDWKFRIKNKQMTDTDFNIPYAEIAAFKNWMDKVVATVKSGKPLEKENVLGLMSPDVAESFTQGTLSLITPTLTKGYVAAAEAGATISDEKKLFKNRNWVELVETISKHRFGDDLHLFLLGCAAENLGYPDAAKIYYEKSIEQSKRPLTGKCIACMGIKLPDESLEALARLSETSVDTGPAAQQTQNKQPSSKPILSPHQ